MPDKAAVLRMFQGFRPAELWFDVALELKGWPYPRHLAGRYFGLVVHGDSVGAETLRRSLADWLTDMGLISAGRMAEADGYVGYMEPYATSHGALDEDRPFQQETVNAARALGNAVLLARAGRLDNPATGIGRAGAEMKLRADRRRRMSRRPDHWHS